MKKMILLALVLVLSTIMVDAHTNSAINAYALCCSTLKNFLADNGLKKAEKEALVNIPFTVATVCMNAKTDTASNLETFTAYINEASQKGAILVVFPEIALQQNPGWGTSSYTPTQEELQYVQDSAETIPGPSTEALVRIAKEHNIFVIFGMTEKSLNGELYNTSVFLGPTGILGEHRKGRLWNQATGGNEHLFWEYGSDNGLVDSPLGSVGLIICIEMYYQLGPVLANSGADFLVTVSAWPSSSGGLYESYTKSNATGSGCWHIVANQVGTVGHATDYGHSRIVNPEGVVVADTGTQEGIVIATIGEITLNVNVDLNGDGIVDANDMCIIVDHWGEDYPSCDIAPPPFGDGIVDVQDLIVLAEHLFEDYRLIAHWALDETEGDIAYDSAKTNDAVVLGDPLWHPEGGIVDGAISFDGIDDYINTDFLLNPANGSFSVYVWIKDGVPGQVVVSQQNTANWLAVDTEGNLITELKGTGRSTGPLLSQTIITNGEWQHIGIVWDGSNRALYVDDILVAEDIQANLQGSESGLYIGTGKSMESGTYWFGLIDDVRVYNRAVKP